MSWQKFAKDYLTFSRKDRIGILSFLALIALIYFLPRLFSAPLAAGVLKPDVAVLKAMDTLRIREEGEKREKKPEPSYVYGAENRPESSAPNNRLSRAE